MAGRTMSRWAALAVVGAAACATGAAATTFEVSTQRDAADALPGDGACEATAGAGDCTLRAAVQETNALPGADVVELPAGRFALSLAGAWEDAAAAGDLDVTDGLVISGAGRELTVVDGAGLDRVLDVPRAAGGATVVLEGLEIRGGSHGGVRSLASGALVLVDCLVASNDAPAAGGGLYVSGGALSLVRCSVRDNRAAMQGAGIAAHAATLTIEDSELSGNVVAGASGGGVHAAKSTVRISRSTIEENEARGAIGEPGRGGGLVLWAADATLTDVVVRDNAAEAGAALLVVGGAAILDGCTLEGASDELARSVDARVTVVATALLGGRWVGPAAFDDAAATPLPALSLVAQR